MTPLRFCLSTVPAALTLACANAQPGFEVLCATGEQAAGLPAGAVFDELELPSINSAGQVVWSATLTGAGVSELNDQGVWMGGPEDALVLRKGDHVPGARIGVDFRNIFQAMIRDDGSVYIVADQMQGLGNGIWKRTSSGLVKIAAAGDVAPGVPEGALLMTRADFTNDPPSIVASDNGTVAFRSVIIDDGDEPELGIWAASEQGLAFVAATGRPVAGSTLLAWMDTLQNPTISPDGMVSFNGRLLSGSGSGVGASSNEANWLGMPGQMEVVAREGAQPSGSPLAFNLPRELVRAGPGQWTFLSTVDEGTETEDSLWLLGGGDLQLLAETGAPAPDTLPGVSFAQLTGLHTGRSGHITLYVSLQGAGVGSGSSRAMYVRAPDESLRLALREGRLAQGMRDGARFGLFAASSAMSGLAIDGAGGIAFNATVTGPGIDDENNYGLWFRRPDGRLRLIFREGQCFRVAPGDVRQVRSFAFAGSGEDGRGAGISPSGDLAVCLWFAEGSGQAIVRVDLNALACPADFDASGEVDVLDLLAFLNGWFAGQTQADRTLECSVDVFDLLSFLDDWFAGC